MIKRLIDYYEDVKKNKGLIYKDIAPLVGLKDKSSAWHVVNNPSRTKKSTFLKVAKVLGMPDKDAVEQWTSENLKKAQDRILQG